MIEEPVVFTAEMEELVMGEKSGGGGRAGRGGATRGGGPGEWTDGRTYYSGVTFWHIRELAGGYVPVRDDDFRLGVSHRVGPAYNTEGWKPSYTLEEARRLIEEDAAKKAGGR